jgi:hypothetical protein
LLDQQTQPSIVASFPSAARIASLQLAPFAVHAVMDFIGSGATAVQQWQFLELASWRFL